MLLVSLRDLVGSLAMHECSRVSREGKGREKRAGTWGRHLPLPCPLFLCVPTVRFYQGRFYYSAHLSLSSEESEAIGDKVGTCTSLHRAFELKKVNFSGLGGTHL